MKRRLLNLLTLLSLLLCVAVAAIWTMSACSAVPLHIPLSTRISGERWIAVGNGRAILVHEVGWPDFRDPLWGKNYEVTAIGLGKGGERGRKFFEGGASAGTYYRWWGVHLWVLVAIFGLLPAYGFVRRTTRRAMKHRPGACHACGYNLTGNISGVCPECGRQTT